MSNTFELLEIAKNAALDCAEMVSQIPNSKLINSFDKVHSRELKSNADIIAENRLFNLLEPTGISIISEERGESKKVNSRNLEWVVDPIDGTVNYLRQISSWAVSIGLWEDNKPIFGVICEYPSRNLYWGGPAIGAFCGKKKIKVSNTKSVSEGVLCTGFPSRYQFIESSESDIFHLMKSFAKVSMLGAASISLLQVAKGSADMYFEDQIMYWDVAAGLALLLGAGGRYILDKDNDSQICKVHAINSGLNLDKLA